MPSPVRDAEPESVLSLWLNNATLATSGIDYRRWQQDGQPVHHLIDPRTGLPAATDVVTASVLCSDARRAEAWATATLVAGCEIGLARLHTQPRRRCQPRTVDRRPRLERARGADVTSMRDACARLRRASSATTGSGVPRRCRRSGQCRRFRARPPRRWARGRSGCEEHRPRVHPRDGRFVPAVADRETSLEIH